GTGRSAAMLYQARGMRDSSRTNLVCRGSDGAMGTPPGWPGWARPRPARDGSLARAANDAQSAAGLLPALRLVDGRLMAVVARAVMLRLVLAMRLCLVVLMLRCVCLGRL